MLVHGGVVEGQGGLVLGGLGDLLGLGIGHHLVERGQRLVPGTKAETQKQSQHFVSNVSCRSLFHVECAAAISVRFLGRQWPGARDNASTGETTEIGFAGRYVRTCS